MDPLSVAASAASVATVGAQLSQILYGLVTTIHNAGKEIAKVANDVSLLAMVLEEVEAVIRQDSQFYRRRLVQVVREVLDGCEGIFDDIRLFIGAQPEKMSSIHFKKRICWYFQRERVRLLQAGLESLKSTLNVLLHTVQLAKIAGAAESNQGLPWTGAAQDDVRKERRHLIGSVLNNKRTILNLREIEEECDRRYGNENVKGKRLRVKASSMDVDERTPRVLSKASLTYEEKKSNELLPNNLRLEDTEENDWVLISPQEDGAAGPVSPAKTTIQGRVLLNTGRTSPLLKDLNDDFNTEDTISGDEVDPQDFSSGRSTPRIPKAQWFLDVVPHAPTEAALVLSPLYTNSNAPKLSSVESGTVLSSKSFYPGLNPFRTWAEETAKTLLLTCTNIDPDALPGDELFENRTSMEDPQVNSIPHLAHQPKWQDHDFAAEAKSKREDAFTLNERIARLESILLEEKAVQAAKEAGAKADKGEDKGKDKPIKFKDAVGRKFSFPFHLCSTWTGMEDLIRQAFLHVEMIGPHVAEGHYDLVGANGEIILPQVWATTIVPDTTITMHMWPMPESEKGEVVVREGDRGQVEDVAANDDRQSTESKIDPPPKSSFRAHLFGRSSSRIVRKAKTLIQ